MGKKLAVVAGSKGTYDITLGDDGVIYCTCWAWKRNRTCKHLDRYHAEHTKPTPKMPSTLSDTVASEVAYLSDS